ncbi:MAG TPA: HAD-IB family hydrolase [Candidatus Binatia bacterium]|nr:HAD-IB family hydrolase [Candidatus Binatia bacterium]
MSERSELTREILDGPSGGKIAAFFDVDRTLIAGFSVIEFIRDGVVSGRMSTRGLLETAIAIAQFQLGQIGFSSFVAGTSAGLRGIPEMEFAAIGERIFRDRLAADVFPESRALVQAHRKKGHTVVVVSSATRYQIDPLAKDLGIRHVLCTRLEVKDGKFTGEVLKPTCYGEGKATAAREFAAAHSIDLEESYFYTDSDEDLPLLAIVGKPRPTNPNGRLREIAVKRAWSIRNFTSRGTPGAAEVVRTSLAVGGLIPSVLLGLPAFLLGGSWRRTLNVALSVWGEIGTAIAGVDLRVQGEGYLWSHRPAVFIFNHQSAIDMLLLCKLLRRDFIGIAKKEVKSNPIFGPVFTLAGVVFIDRANHEQAIRALEPAVEALRQGLSIAIAPEGTRSPTPKLGRFKKGAFHLAMTAQVPIVPIVFKNALDALPKHAMFVRPATVEAVVHKPIPTGDWTAENLPRKIAAVHRLYQRTLKG